MRIRTIKPEFWTSESVGKLSRDARLLFIALWSFADDEGRGRGAFPVLAGSLYPYDPTSGELLPHWWGELEAAGMVRRYTVGGTWFYDIPKWKQHQKIKKPTPSRIPPFPHHSPTSGEPVGNSSPTPGGLDLGSRTVDLGSRTVDLAPARAHAPECAHAIEGEPGANPASHQDQDMGTNKPMMSKELPQEPQSAINPSVVPSCPKKPQEWPKEQNPWPFDDEAHDTSAARSPAIGEPLTLPGDRPLRFRPAGPTEDDEGMPADLWRMGIQGRQWARALITAGAKIGPQNWPAWWGILVSCYGATKDNTNHQALVDIVDRQMVRKKIEAWPDEARRLVEAAQAEERDAAKPGRTVIKMSLITPLPEGKK